MYESCDIDTAALKKKQDYSVTILDNIFQD